VFDEQGRALGRRISNRDITSRKRAEESLREQEKLYRSIFETTAEGLAICTLDGLIVEANPAFCKMHGHEVGAVARQRMVTFIHPTDRYVLAQSVQAVKRGETFASQAVHLRIDDQPFHAETRVVGLTYYGQPHLLIIVRDVSAELGAYLRLEQRVKERTHELSMLLEFSHSMTRTLEMKPLLRLILDQLRSVVDYTSASILSLTGKEMTMVAHQGPIAESDQRQLHVSIDSPLGRMALDPLRPVIIADVHGDSPLARVFQATLGNLLDTTLHYIRSWLGIPMVITDRTVGLLAISHQQINYFTQRHADLALAFANQAAMAMENARLYEQAQDLAAMQERQRLARDLHDSVSQTLFSASLAAQVLPRLWERQPVEGQQCLDELGRLTRGALAEMRTLLVELRPNVLVESKLGDLLRQLVEAIISRTRVPVQVVIEGEAALPPDVQVALYRIAQEALNNVAKHANANQAIIRLQYYPLEQPFNALDNSLQVGVELSISDDGRGFSPVGISADHLGLGIMRERADAINADLMMESQIGCGTYILVRWPRTQVPAGKQAHVFNAGAV
jgi:PAS domain S-box-containing protein